MRAYFYAMKVAISANTAGVPLLKNFEFAITGKKLPTYQTFISDTL